MASRRKPHGEGATVDDTFSVRKLFSNVYLWIGLALSGLAGITADFDNLLEFYRKMTTPPAPLRVEISDLRVYPTVGSSGPPGGKDFLNNIIDFLVRIDPRRDATTCDYKFAIDPAFVPTILNNPQPFTIPANVTSFRAQHWITFQPPSPFRRYTFRIECNGTASNAVTFEVVQSFEDIDPNSGYMKGGDRSQ